MKIAKKLAVAACVASAFTMMNTQAEETKAPVSVSQAGTALPAGVTQGPSIEGVTEYRLTNGLKLNTSSQMLTHCPHPIHLS